jgi:hypothetical protein
MIFERRRHSRFVRFVEGRKIDWFLLSLSIDDFTLFRVCFLFFCKPIIIGDTPSSSRQVMQSPRAYVELYEVVQRGPQPMAPCYLVVQPDHRPM